MTNHQLRMPARTAQSTRRVLLGGFCALALLVAVPSLAEERSTFTFDAEVLSVANLVGEVEILPAAGSRFEIEATVSGADAAPGLVTFETREGSRARFFVRFPVDRHRRYVYPEYRGRTTLSRNYDDGSSTLLGKLLDAMTGGSVEVSGRGSGLEVWTDLVVRVPAGARLELENGVGDLLASGVRADLRVSSSSGKLTGESLRGDTAFDLGSGSVTLSDIDGTLLVDTGSGSVTLKDFSGPSATIDTGSGRVILADVRTRSLTVDTGSGSVEADGVSAEEAIIDTGSGSVRLALSEMGPGDFRIDTGSGGITLLLPEYASAVVVAETGSGGIDVALDDVKLVHRERDEMKFEVGSGEARVVLDTGSGGIRIAALEP